MMSDESQPSSENLSYKEKEMRGKQRIVKG